MSDTPQGLYILSLHAGQVPAPAATGSRAVPL